MAFRGIQIWNIIQRMKVIDTVQRLKWVDPFTRHAARALKPITSPIRLAFRSFTWRQARRAQHASKMATRTGSRPSVVATMMDNPLTRTWSRTTHTGPSKSGGQVRLRGG